MEVIRRPFIAVRLVPARRLASTRPNLAPLPIESEPIPTHAPPAPWQRGAQALGFVLAGIAGVYSVLFYDFQQENHCFVPIRRQFAAIKDQFMTLPDSAPPATPKTERFDKPESQKRLV